MSVFLWFEKFLIENNTGYHICLFNNLQFKSDRKKKWKLDNCENYHIYMVVPKLKLSDMGHVIFIQSTVTNI